MAIDLETDARGVMTLWLARPDVHNAMNAEMMDEITAAVSELKPGAGVRALILAGRGKSFCAGGDLAWMQAQFLASATERALEGRRLAEMLLALHELDVPVIGRVHGAALGGGVGLAAVCDVAIGVAGQRFGLTETRLGLIPATIGPYLAARLGPSLRAVFMSSRIFDAQEALRLGLLGRVVSPEELDQAVEEELAAYLQAAPGAVAEAKQLARALGPRIDETVITETIEALVRRWESAEAAEGVGAFFEKRPPSWMVR